MYEAFQTYFQGMPPDQAGTLAASVEILRPYGTVGHLPWMRRAGHSIKFGGPADSRTLVNLASQIRTFSEGTDHVNSDINRIRASILNTDTLVFLGFAFHPINLELLFPSGREIRPSTVAPKIYATAHGMSESDVQSLEAALALRAAGINGNAQPTLRRDLTAAGIFSEFRRHLSFT